MKTDTIIKLFADYPDSEVVRQTEQGTLIRSNGTDKKYFVVPPCFVSDYEEFKHLKPSKFRAFLYFIGSVCRELNKATSEGTYRENMNGRTPQMQGYYAEICLEPVCESTSFRSFFSKIGHDRCSALYQKYDCATHQKTCE